MVMPFVANVVLPMSPQNPSATVHAFMEFSNNPTRTMVSSLCEALFINNVTRMIVSEHTKERMRMHPLWDSSNSSFQARSYGICNHIYTILKILTFSKVRSSTLKTQCQLDSWKGHLSFTNSTFVIEKAIHK